jgi:hypothetical protein
MSPSVRGVAGSRTGSDARTRSGGPASIPRHHLSQADWRFLLPSLELGRVAVLGRPPAGLVRGVSALAEEVVVVAFEGRVVPVAERESIPAALDNVRALRGRGSEALVSFHGAFDLVVIPAGQLRTVPLADPRFAREVAAILRPGGLIYLEARGVRDRLGLGRRLRRLEAAGLSIRQRFWLVHRKGSIWAAFPNAPGRESADYLIRNVLHGTSSRGRILTRLAGTALGPALLRLALPGTGLLLGRGAPTGEAMAPFAYLNGHRAVHPPAPPVGRTGFFARGAYDSNKVGFFLFRDPDGPPEILVKMTRTPAFNPRLEQEYRALRCMEERDLAAPGTYPRALFLGLEAGLAVLGEEALTGVPFRTRTTGRADCALARNAIDWIVDLGTRSAGREAADPLWLAHRYRRLLEGFQELFGLNLRESEVLEAGGARLASIPRGAPPVMRHGDAGTWNILAPTGGGVAFLDWEASEEDGPPLWDLFDFFRSLGQWIERRRMRRGRRIYASGLLEGGPLGDLQVETVRRYCASVGVDRELVEPLFLSCWMQRALREAEWSRRPIQDGTFVRLVRLAVAERRSSALQRLFT